MTLFIRSALALALCCLLPAAAAAAPAEPPPVLTAQAPGFYRMALGDYTITALYDGYVDLDADLLKGASAQDIQSLLAKLFVRTTPGMQTAVNAYLIHDGNKLVLVDTGAGKCFGPTLGGMESNIRAAGYEPAQVSTVLLTHLHPDHACGLLGSDGQALFSNAQVYASRDEAGFWLNQALAAKAPAEMQPFFTMARTAVAPYQAAGRFHTYMQGETLAPGLTALPTPGHTPGHTSYLFEMPQHSLLVWGDIVHSHATQFARPDIAIEFDVDSNQAVATRKKLFADAAHKKFWVAGAHMPFPGLGRVIASGEGYAWVPVEYGPIRDDLR